MKRTFAWITLLLVALLSLGQAALAEETAPLNIAVLKGPTGMGAAPLMHQSDAGETEGDYAFTIEGAPDAVTAKLITGELDMAALPTNTIALLNQRTEGGVQIVAVNTLGVLYVLEKGDGVSAPGDLTGKSIVTAGQGTTVEAVANYLFDDSVTVDYVSEHAEAIAQAVAGQYDLVLLPEPFVTSLLAQDAGFRIAIDLTAAWMDAANTVLPMGGIAIRSEVAADHERINLFLEEYAASVAYANENPAETAEWIEGYDIMQATVAEQAIPRANMVCLTGADMRDALLGFFSVLETENPELIGGQLPDVTFYYAP